MLAGSLVVSVISSKWATWTAMILLLAIHLGTNYMAVRAVCMRTLNRQRANIVFSTIIEGSTRHDATQMKEWVEKKTYTRPLRMDGIDYLSPEEVYLQERIFERDGVLRWKGGESLGYCRLGVKLREILDLLADHNKTTGSYNSSPSEEFSKLLEVFDKVDYIMWYDESHRIFLVALKATGSYIHLRAWFHALLFARHGRVKDDESLLEALQRTCRYVSEVWEEIEQHLREVEWDLDVDAMLTQSSTSVRISHAA
jgi:hypothetical protein